jgi:hypothetical protein
MTGSGDHPRHFLLCHECLKTIFTRSPQFTRPSVSPNPALTEEQRKQETRRQNAFERLGTDHPICACCGETDWRCMELHHLEGKDFGDTLIIVCRNCHRKLSDVQKDHPPRFGEPPKSNESFAHLLHGVADALSLIANKLREVATYLRVQAPGPSPNTKLRQP